MEGIGADKVDGSRSNIEQVEDIMEDTIDGQCLGGMAKDNSDQRYSIGNLNNFSEKACARMPVDKYSSHYNMNHPKRGLALVFCHKTFDDERMASRLGTDKDCQNIQKCLNALGFVVHFYKDLNYSDIVQQIEQTAKADHSKHDCILVTILTHGSVAGTIFAKDVPYKPDTLWSPFSADKCPTLAGKPKIFFIQACRGTKVDGGVRLSRTETDGDVYNNYTIPVEADFLIVYSSVEGYYSFRNKEDGSWFIQTLCNQLKQRAINQDLMTILTFVSQHVAVDFESYNPTNLAIHNKKQVPCVLNMLTRLIQFNHKEV